MCNVLQYVLSYDFITDRLYVIIIRRTHRDTKRDRGGYKLKFIELKGVEYIIIMTLQQQKKIKRRGESRVEAVANN